MAIYFSHPIVRFNTEASRRAEDLLSQQGLGMVINPSEDAHQSRAACTSDYWSRLVGMADAIALLPLEDGRISSSVFEDGLRAMEHQLPVYLLSIDGSQMRLVQDLTAENIEVLSVKESMELIRAHMVERESRELNPFESLPSADVYFAHPISTYCTPLEEKALALLKEFEYHTIINPSQKRHQDICGPDMRNWVALALKAQCVAILPFEDGSIGSGTWAEAQAVKSMGGDVILFDPDANTLKHCRNFPEGLNLLTVAETRERIRHYKNGRIEQGLSPIASHPNTDLENTQESLISTPQPSEAPAPAVAAASFSINPLKR